jgi:N-formylglutamate deformylase
MKTYEFCRGTRPLLLSMPHDGTGLPDDIGKDMTDNARRLPDTDWHVARLYGFARGLGASLIRPLHSRFVIDLNRAPDGRALYEGASNTELCPTSCFDDTPVYLPGRTPSPAETERRRAVFWQPYHTQIERELTRLRDAHGIALLFDAHSIRSQVPRFFSGTLPDFNLGTADGSCCAAGLQAVLQNVLEQAEPYSHVTNGRFKGGYITRAYGQPDARIHSVQLELSQATYMVETFPFEYAEQRAKRVQPVLRRLLESMLSWTDAPVTV